MSVSQASSPAAARFAVVGVGASAGGLEAFGQLLEALPATTGMAFLLVQHLDPHHASALSELLAPRCRIPVSDARHDEVVAPDHVYVIPPNVTMTLSQGRVCLVPRPAGGPHLPVDDLFRSLASERPGGAIGVVLSGNGADGTKGIEAIKASGGLTFAQSDQTATNASMPRNATQSGCVDQVLGPAQIAIALVAVAATGAFPIEGEVSAAVADRDLTAVLALLFARHGVDFGAYRTSALVRRVERRMALRRISGVPAYADLLGKDQVEVDALYDDLLINVTSFFRDPESFAALRTLVFPAMLAEKPAGDPIRIWVPGCSTGQEVYSILMALMEHLDGLKVHRPIQVFATDLSVRYALRVAREGLYPQTIESEVSAERLARFFVRVDDSYRIGKTLRDAVVFARHDVGADPPFSHMDLITCRNVLIYLSPALQHRVIATLHYALEPGGFLMLGSAETVGGAADLFTVVDQRTRVYRKRPGGHRVPRHFRSPPSLPDGPTSVRAGRVPDQRTEADRVSMALYVPPAILVDGGFEVLEFRGDTSPFLSPPVGQPSQDLRRLVRDGLFLDLRSAIEECRQTDAVVVRTGVFLANAAGGGRPIDVRVAPVPSAVGGEPCFLVVFQESPPAGWSAQLRPGGWVPRWIRSRLSRKVEPDTEAARLRKELGATREYLQSVLARHDVANEVLTSANEEIASGNEELQSTNEELETAKEELQSVNEELLTVNEQLHTRNADLTVLSDDLTNLLGSAAVPMVAVDAELQVRRFTPAAAAVLHLLPTDIGRRLGSLRLPLAMADLDQRCAAVLATAEVFESEIRDDHGHWYTLRIHPYRATDGRTYGAVVVLADIQDAKRAQELLRDSRDYVAAIVEAVQDPLAVLGLDLRLQSANHAFHERFGTSADQVVGLGLDQLPLGWVQAAVPLLQEMQGRERTLRAVEIVDGRGQVWLLNANRMVGEGAGGERILLAIEDVTASRRIRAELATKADELAAADRRKNEFLAILAHELRTPLTPVRYALQIQRLAPDDPESKVRTQAMMERQVRHMTRLVDDLLDVSRIGLGRIELRRRQVDLGAEVARTVDVEQPQIERAGHRVQLVVPPVPVLLYADPVRVDQIVGNLLTNALKYTDPGGRIAITVTVDGPWSVLEVADDGVGLSATLLPQVWDLFSQAEWSADRTRGGLGIGLALVKSLAEMHGGSVEAHSDGPGRGSRFVVRLPLVAEEVGLEETESAAPCEPAAPRRRVLVVDDDPDVTQSLALLLELMGHEVRVANDGPTALAAAVELRPEFVFLDIGLQGQSGLDLARRLRQDQRLEQTVLVALTGYGSAEDRQRSIEAGFNFHLVKPAEPDELDRVLGGRSPFETPAPAAP